MVNTPLPPCSCPLPKVTHSFASCTVLPLFVNPQTEFYFAWSVFEIYINGVILKLFPCDLAFSLDRLL